MLLSAILLALVTGALAGGGLPRLADLKLRWLWLLGLALAVRILTGLAASRLSADLPIGWGYVATYLLLLAWLWGNWRVAGLQVAAVGIGLNAAAVIINAGRMPIWSGAFAAAGLTPDLLAGDSFHYLLHAATVSEFVRGGGLFGDVLPIPLPVLRDVVSIGDLLLALGIFWAIFSSMTRPAAPLRYGWSLAPSPLRPSAGGEFEAGIAYAGAFAGTATLAPGTAAREAALPAAEGRRQSVYLGLARNRNFSLLWVGQLVSFFGDRIHQIALVFLLSQFGTPLDLGITFAATAIPNVFLGPLAGALVDRWDRRRTMIACDLLRAGLVLLVPVVIHVSVWLVYLIAFAVATVSLLFRPAKTAVLPRIVRDEELVTANSATTVSETLADLIGYPLAGVVVAALSGLIAAAFMLDAVTYLVSAFLILGMLVPRDTAEEARPFRPGAVWREMAEGWRFLRGQAELFTNTIVSAVAQVAVGAEVVASALYARTVLDLRMLGYPENYSWLMASLGLGSIIGGLAIGGLASRVPKGRLTIAGFVGIGLTLVAAGMVTNPFVALGIYFFTGVTNMLFLIPNMTLFQERTPQRLMGRVVSTRQAIVFGVMTLAMAGAGWLSGIIGPAAVLVSAGAICALAGLSGLLLPAMRNAR